MFIRLLIWVIVAILVYRAIKSLLGGSEQHKVRATRQPPKRVEDVMIQDPQCGVYFARKDGVPLTVDGQEVLFCSEACRDAFSAKGSHQ